MRFSQCHEEAGLSTGFVVKQSKRFLLTTSQKKGEVDDPKGTDSGTKGVKVYWSRYIPVKYTGSDTHIRFGVVGLKGHEYVWEQRVKHTIEWKTKDGESGSWSDDWALDGSPYPSQANDKEGGTSVAQDYPGIDNVNDKPTKAQMGTAARGLMKKYYDGKFTPQDERVTLPKDDELTYLKITWDFLTR